MEFIKLVEGYLSKTMGVSIFVSSFNSLGGGCINNASKLKTNIGDFFLKWNSDCSPDMFLREAEGLKELAKASGGVLTIPKVFCAKQVDEMPGFLIQEYLPPKNLNVVDDEKLGRGLAIIHKYEYKNFGFYNDNYCGATHQKNKWCGNWCKFYIEQRLGFLLQLIQKKRLVSSSHKNIIESFLLKIPQLIPNDTKPRLIHGDLWSGNYMFSEYGPALIDPAAYYADREMEFAIMTMFGGFSERFYSAYNEENPLDPDWQSRNGIYQLYHILNHYYLFGGAYLHQAIEIVKRYV